MSNELTIDTVFEKIKNLSKIVILKEEDNVIRDLIRGTSKTKVLAGLQKKYPEESITAGNLDSFLMEYRHVLDNEVLKLSKDHARRIVKSQEGLTNELIDLAVTSKDLIAKFQQDDDNTNTIAAIKAASDIFMKVGKVQGIFEEKPEVSVNIQMDKVINEVTTQDSELKNKILQGLRGAEVVVEAEVVDE